MLAVDQAEYLIAKMNDAYKLMEDGAFSREAGKNANKVLETFEDQIKSFEKQSLLTKDQADQLAGKKSPFRGYYKAFGRW